MIAKRRVASWFLVAAALTGMTCAPRGDPNGFDPTKDKISANIQDPPPVPAAFKERIDAALDHVRRRDLLTTNGFWTVFHGILGQGFETTLLNPDSMEKVKAIDYICEGKPLRGLVFEPKGDAGLDVQTQPGFGIGQGHQDQFVAEMTQWGMPLDKKFVVNGKDHTFADFVRYSKTRTRVTATQELSWAILIVAQYFGTDITWTNEANEQVRFEDVVRYELDQPIDTAACGGTHRLFGLTWAYHLHMQRGGKKTGVWKDVADKIDLYKKQARQFQNPDGSFSTEYVSKPGNVPDTQVRIGTTGHVLEWLALALSDEEIREPWVQEAANALVMMILENRTDPIEGGSLYHATHGLYIYRARVFGTQVPGLLIPPAPKK
jgi:hypothetical protein